MNIGLQTYTIRREQKRDLESSYRKLLDIGIRDLELARIDFTRGMAERIKKLKDELGIQPVALQVKPKDVFANPGKIIDFAHTVGSENVVISMLPFSAILGGESVFYKFLDGLDAEAEKYEKEGITLAYHHHNWEYVRLKNGRTRMDELLTRTSKIRFVTDTYWSARSGVDPAAAIKRFEGRLLGVHLRDLANRSFFLDVIPHDTVIGRGVLDFSSILKAAESVGCRYLVIEQNSKTPYSDIKESYDALMKINLQEIYDG